MSFKFALAAASAAGLLVTGAAAPGFARSPEEPAAKSARQCFWARNVNNFASNDERVVNIRVGVRDVYQLEMLGRCPDVDWANSIAIRSRGSNYICSGLDAELIAPSPIGPQRCAVSKIRKLTAEEAKALPKHARP
jgi:hypothetical protein